MASQSDIDIVTGNIESDYMSHGWSEQVITDRLDAAVNPARIIALYWRMRASATITLVNTSESGSSRGNDAIYNRMKALADEWETKALAIENPVTADTGRGRLGSFPIKRV